MDMEIVKTSCRELGVIIAGLDDVRSYFYDTEYVKDLDYARDIIYDTLCKIREQYL